MATRKPKPAGDQPPQARARALVDLPAHGVASGQLLTADPATVAMLVAAGQADDHADAVAFATDNAPPPSA
jgi:hypothetical protein